MYTVIEDDDDLLQQSLTQPTLIDEGALLARFQARHSGKAPS